MVNPIISVNTLENRLNRDPANIAQGINYDFFKNVSNRDQLKRDPFSFTGNPIDAFLLAQPSINNFTDIELASTIVNTSVGHDGITQNRGIINSELFQNRNIFRDSTSEISTSEVSTSKIGASEVSTSEVSTSEVSTSKKYSIQISPTQISPTQISPTQISLVQGRSTEKSITQISPAEITVPNSRLTNISPIQISPTQISSSEIGISQLSLAQINSSQIDSFEFGITDVSIGELPFSSSISSQDFVNIVEHNPKIEIINNLNNTATNIWSTHLNPSTPLDIDFQITDLPPGQLAEATITSFNPNGTPNAGTIQIDHNANDVGWFIDPTPSDNSEFGVRNSEFGIRSSKFTCPRMGEIQTPTSSLLPNPKQQLTFPALRRQGWRERC